MRHMFIAATVAALIATPAMANHGNGNAMSGANSPTATNNNPSSCLGAERATRNSRGGDRDQGGFGPAQSDQVQMDNDAGTNFGQGTLATFRETCEFAPGDMNDD